MVQPIRPSVIGVVACAFNYSALCRLGQQRATLTSKYSAKLKVSLFQAEFLEKYSTCMYWEA